MKEIELRFQDLVKAQDNSRILENILDIEQKQVKTGNAILDEILQPFAHVNYAIEFSPEGQGNWVVAAEQGRQIVLTATPEYDLKSYLLVREFEREILRYAGDFARLTNKLDDLPSKKESAKRASERAQEQLDSIDTSKEGKAPTITSIAERTRQENKIRELENNVVISKRQISDYDKEIEKTREARGELAKKAQRLSDVAGELSNRVNNERFAKELAKYEVRPNKYADVFLDTSKVILPQSHTSIVTLTDIARKEPVQTRRSALGTLGMLISGAAIGTGSALWFTKTPKDVPLAKEGLDYVVQNSLARILKANLKKGSEFNGYKIDFSVVDTSKQELGIIFANGDIEHKYAINIRESSFLDLDGKRYIVTLKGQQSAGITQPVIQIYDVKSHSGIAPRKSMIDMLPYPFVKEVIAKKEGKKPEHIIVGYTGSDTKAFSFYTSLLDGDPTKIKFSYSRVDIGDDNLADYSTPKGNMSLIHHPNQTLIAEGEFVFDPKKTPIHKIKYARKIQ